MVVEEPKHENEKVLIIKKLIDSQWIKKDKIKKLVKACKNKDKNVIYDKVLSWTKRILKIKERY